MPAIYIAYPSSLTLRSANAIQTFQTTRALRRLDPALVVLLPRLPGRPSDFEGIGAIHLPRLPFNVLHHLLRTTLWSYLERSWFALLTALWLLWRRQTGPTTILYIRDAVVAAWYGGLLRRLLGVRLVYEIHDLEAWNPSRARSLLLAPLVRLIDRAALGGSTRVVTLTEDFRRHLIETGQRTPERIGVIPDAYDDEVFTPLEQAAARQALALAPTAFIALYSGFTFAYRQVDRLVAAWAEVRQRDPSAILCLVGGRPSEIEALRHQAAHLGIAESLHIGGLQPPSIVARYLAAADVLVIPGTVSGRNASPLKMFEYMAMQRPIISVDLLSLREILGDDGALYVPAGDVAALAAALLQLASTPALAASLAAHAHARALAYTYRARGLAVQRQLALAAVAAP